MPSQHLAPAIQKPTGAFVAASWTAMLVGALTFLTGLWNASLKQKTTTCRNGHRHRPWTSHGLAR